MVANYLSIALRMLRRSAVYSAINIAGFSVSLACCFVIGLYLKTEFSYDGFHDKGDRIYRYIVRYEESGRSVSQCWTPYGLAPLLKSSLPQDVDAVTRVESLSLNPLARLGDKEILIGEVATVDSSFFNIFSFDLIRGRADNVLNKPLTMVISESTAFINFGTEDPVGKLIRYEDQYDIEITGVYKDMPANSHIRYDAMISFLSRRYFNPDDADVLNTMNVWNTETYVLTRKNLDPETVARSFKEKFYAVYANGARLPEDAMIDLWQPIKSIHFTQGIKGNYSTGNINYAYMAVTLGVVILFIACFNFMNLSTAMAIRRAKEVGLRKSLGALRHQLIMQFLGETFIQVLLSVMVAILIVQLSLPIIRQAFGLIIIQLSLSDYLFALIGFVVITTLLAGAYPAFYISRYLPAKVLKGGVSGNGKSLFRNALTTFQFGASIFLLAVTGIVFAQLHFLRNAELGFDTERIATIYANKAAKENYTGMREKLLSYSHIADVTISNARLSNLEGYWRYIFPNHEVEESQGITTLIVSDGYFEFMNMKLAEGRTLSSGYGTDKTNGYMVNEAFVKEYMIEDPLNTELQVSWDSTSRGNIVGVVRDFHFQPLHMKIKPLIIRMDDNNAWLISIKLSGDIKQGIREAELVWKEFSGGAPFDYKFLDDSIQSSYDEEQKASTMLTSLTCFAIGISMLGLLGLTAFMAVQRRKEIGIRKVLGSSKVQIVKLLSGEVLRLFLIAFALSVPAAWYFGREWLQNFAYRIEVNPLIFLGAGILVMMITIAIVSYQGVRSAAENPANILRSE